MKRSSQPIRISKEIAARKMLNGQIEAITLKDNAPERFSTDTSYKTAAEAIRAGYVVAVCVYTFAGSSWYEVAAE